MAQLILHIALNLISLNVYIRMPRANAAIGTADARVHLNLALVLCGGSRGEGDAP